jgi:hypothetical protein
MRASFTITPTEFWSLIGTAEAPLLVYDGLLAYLHFAATERHNRPAQGA